MTIPPLNLPGGYSAMGAPPPACALSYDGCAFYAFQSKFRGREYAFRVFRQPNDGSVATLVLMMPMADPSLGGGQGSLLLQGDGGLTATAYSAPGDGKQPVCMVVPQWVAWPRGGGSDGSAPAADQGTAACIPVRTHPQYNGVAAPAGTLHMPSLFGTPPGVKKYDLRFCGLGLRDVRLRLGPNEANPAASTICLQVDHQEYHGEATCYPGDGDTLYYSYVGALPIVWIQVKGYTR